MSRRFLTFAANLVLVAAQLTSSSLESHVDTLTLSSSFNPVKEAYWTGFPHHRRTPFAVSPDGKSAYLAYLDSTGTGVHVQGVNPETFAAVGDAVSISAGKEAGGLVAHDDGFALLTNEVISGEADSTPIAVLYRYTAGKQTFRTLLGGPGIDSDNELASPDINGDLVFSEKAGYYAAYIVVTSYSGSASGHFGDAIRYITTEGKLETITGASSSWGCSHNTGIAFEEADQPPFASLCAEDQGAIWLNTETQGMGNNGVKVSNEMTINGASNEPMGGMSGSYSSLARFIDSSSYIFSWVSRGAVDLTLNDWMGEGYTKAQNRTNNRNVAIAIFSDKKTLDGEQATSEVGAADGDSQVNWITQGSNDCSNAHAAAFDSSSALISWEEISSPICPFEAMGCEGEFAGTSFQLVNSDGEKVGDVVTSQDTYVAGDMVTMSDGRICWPYVSMDWSLDGPTQGSSVTKMSFACMSASGSGSGSGSGSSSASSSAAVATKSEVASQATSAAAVQSTTAADVQSTIDAVEETTSSLPADAPRPSFVTLSQSLSNNLPAATSDASPMETSAAGVESSSIVDSSSAIVLTSVSLPAGAPRPSFVTLSQSLSNNLPTATSESSPVETSAAGMESSPPIMETSAPAVAPSSSLPAGAPRPSLVTLSESVSNNVPVPTSVAPVESSAAIESSAADIQTSAIIPSAPVVSSTPGVIPSATSGFQTRTRNHTRHPHHTRRPHASGSKKPCNQNQAVKTEIVYVTATA
ncbi:Fc.00g020010.m01.CDS01 [Cosmosporella sp. VM-42]